MGNYIAKRLVYAILTLLGVSLVAFLLVQLIPGDPAIVMLGPFATEESVQLMRERLRLDDPLWSQYSAFLTGVIGGNLRSIRFDRPALALLLGRFPATVELTVGALLIAIFISVFAGILSATKRGTIVDFSATSVALFGLSMPEFWLAIMFILILAVHLGWFPVFGYPPASFIESMTALFAHGDFSGLLTFVRFLTLPALALGMRTASILTRMIRSSILEEISKDYVTTARAKGLRENVVVTKHVFRNSLIPVVTMCGMQFARLLSGAIIIEVVFAWPGVGRLMVDSIFARDFPVIQVGILFFSTVFIVMNLFVDILYTYLDPRIQYK